MFPNKQNSVSMTNALAFLLIATLTLMTTTTNAQFTPTNLLVNGGCEALGATCSSVTPCNATNSLWMLPTSSSCGVYCTGGSTQNSAVFSGWGQSSAGIGTSGIGCVYLNVSESPTFGGNVIGAPYEGNGFFSLLTSTCSGGKIFQIINFPSTITAAINAGLVQTYMFAAVSNANNTGLQVTNYFYNGGTPLTTFNINSPSTSASPIPSSITWTLGSVTNTVPTTSTRVFINVMTVGACSNLPGRYGQLDGMIAYVFSSACIGLPTFPIGQTNTSACSSSYTVKGATCLLQCLPNYMSSGGNFTAVCNTTWTAASHVYNNWIIGTGACVPTSSQSTSHKSHSVSRMSKSLSHESHSKSHSHKSHSKSHKSHSHRSDSKSHKSHSHRSHSHSKSHASRSHSESHYSHSHKSHSYSLSMSHNSDSRSKSHKSHSYNSKSVSHHSQSHESPSMSYSYGAYDKKPVNIITNGGCELSGNQCSTTEVCEGCGNGGFNLPNSPSCGNWCNQTVPYMTAFYGWSSGFPPYSGFGCVYKNISMTACNGGSIIKGPYEGNSFFAVGLYNATFGINTRQSITLSGFVNNYTIDAGFAFYFSSMVGASYNFSHLFYTVGLNSPSGRIRTDSYDIQTAGAGVPTTVSWIYKQGSGGIPVGTRSITIALNVNGQHAAAVSTFAFVDNIILYVYTSACQGFPVFPYGQTNTSTCNSTYTVRGGICTLQCLPQYMPSGGNFTAVCNSTWTTSSMINNNWILGSGSCVPTSSESHSHMSHSKSHNSDSKSSSIQSKSHQSKSLSDSLSQSISLSPSYPHYITNHTNSSYCTSYTSQLFLQGTTTFSCGSNRCICSVDLAYFGLVTTGTCNSSLIHANQTCSTNLTSLVYSRCYNQHQCSFQWGVDFGPPAGCNLTTHQQATFVATGQCCNCLSMSESHSASAHSDSHSLSKSHESDSHSLSKSHESHSHRSISLSPSHESDSRSKSHESDSHSHSHSKSHHSDSHSDSNSHHSKTTSHITGSHSHRSGSHRSHSDSHESESKSRSDSHESDSHSKSHKSKSKSHESHSHSKSHKSHSISHRSHSHSKSHGSKSHSHRSHSHSKSKHSDSHSKSHASHSHSPSHHSESHSQSISISVPECPPRRTRGEHFDLDVGSFCFSATTLVYPDLSFSIECANGSRFCSINSSSLGYSSPSHTCINNNTFYSQSCAKNMTQYVTNLCAGQKTCNLDTRHMIMSGLSNFSCGEYIDSDITFLLTGTCCKPVVSMVRKDIYGFDAQSLVTSTDEVPVCSVQLKVTPTGPFDSFYGISLSPSNVSVNGEASIVNVTAQMVLYLSPFHQQLAANFSCIGNSIQPAVLFVNGCDAYQQASSVSQLSQTVFNAVPYSRDFTTFCRETYQSNLPLVPYWQYDLVFPHIALPSALTKSRGNQTALAIVMKGLMSDDFYYVDQITVGYSDGTVIRIPSLSCDSYTLETFSCKCTNYYSCNLQYVTSPIMFDNARISQP